MAFATLVPAAPLLARDAALAPAVFEEVVVTARKREESLADIPVAITAFNEEEIAKRNMGDLYDVGKNTPNLFIGNFGNGNQNHTSLFMRGVGTQDHIITVDSAVGLYLDGVYLGRQVGSNLSLSNIERVEVARGPQGTLHGRNAIGGAINIITRKPDGRNEVALGAQAGTRGRVKFDLHATSAPGDHLATSLTGFFDQREGIGEFINQPHTNTEIGQIREAGLRAMIDFVPADEFSVLLTADVSDSTHGQTPSYFNAPPGQYPNELPGGLFAPDPDDSASPAGHIAKQTSGAHGFSATADWYLGHSHALKFIGAYRYGDYRGGMDQQDSSGSVVFPERGEAHQYSAELQLIGDFAVWKYVTGAYYFTEDGETVSRPFELFPPFVTDGEINIAQEVESLAWFGAVDAMFGPALTLGGGLRITRDKKDAAGVAALHQPAIPVPRSANWTEWSWDVSATYAINDDLNFHAAVSRGYQSGGFPARPFGGPATFVSFDPQFALSYEVGIKGVLAKRLRLAGTAFWTNYTDLQLQTSRFNPAFGFLTITENAAESRARGVELEATLYLNENFNVQTAVGYLDAEYTDVAPAVIGAVKGGIPQLTPDWTVSIAPEIALPLHGGNSLTLRLNYSFRGRLYGESNNDPLNHIASRQLLDFNLRYQPANSDWRVALYGENVFNEVYDTASGTFGNPFAITLRSNDRSEFGLRVSTSFGGD